jgi:hypothetical protein
MGFPGLLPALRVYGRKREVAKKQPSQFVMGGDRAAMLGGFEGPI